jgi:predicted hotdog family 3-hydroxylacyl-ACP dehydratase
MQEMFREPEGDVSAWIGLEYMAQCIAVHAGLSRPVSEQAPPIGLLVSGRRVRFLCTRFSAEQRLEVVARRIWIGSSGLASFDCSIRDAETGELLAEGRLNCFTPRQERPEG